MGDAKAHDAELDMQHQGGWAPQNPNGNYASLPPQQSYGAVNPGNFQASPQRKVGGGNLNLLGAPVQPSELQTGGNTLSAGYSSGGVRQPPRDATGLFPGHDQARRPSHEALSLSSHLYAHQQHSASQHPLSAGNSNQYNSSLSGGLVAPSLNSARAPSNPTLNAQQSTMDLYGLQRSSIPGSHYGVSNTGQNQHQQPTYTDQAQQFRGAQAQQYTTTYQVQPLSGHGQYQQPYNQASHGMGHHRTLQPQDPPRQRYGDSSLFSNQSLSYAGGGRHSLGNEARHPGAGNRAHLSDHVMMLPLDPRADTYNQGNYPAPRTTPSILTHARPSSVSQTPSRQAELPSSLSTEEHIKEHFVMSLKDDLKNWVQADDDDRGRKRLKLVSPQVRNKQPKAASSDKLDRPKTHSRKRKGPAVTTEPAVANGPGGDPLPPGMKVKKPRKKKEGGPKKEGGAKKDSKKQKATAAFAHPAPQKQVDIRDWVIQKAKGADDAPRPVGKGPDGILCSEELGHTDSESDFAEPQNVKRVYEETEDKKPQMPETVYGMEGLPKNSKEEKKASKPKKEKKEKPKKLKTEKENEKTDAIPEGETTEEEPEVAKGIKRKNVEEVKESKGKEKKRQKKKQETEVPGGSSTDTEPEIFAQKAPKPPTKRKEKNEKNTKKGHKENESQGVDGEKSVGMGEKKEQETESFVASAKEEAGGKGSKKKKKAKQEVKVEEVPVEEEVLLLAEGVAGVGADPQPWVPPVPIVDARREDEEVGPNQCTEEGQKEAVCVAVANVIKTENSKGGKKKVSVDVDRAVSVLDEEDLRFLRLVTMHYPSAEDFGGIKLPITRQEMRALGAAIPGSGEHQEYVVPKSRRAPHASGSARTEGHYQLTVGAKMANMAAAPIDPAWLNSISVSAQQVAAQKQSGSTRTNRADARYTSGSVSDTQGNMLNKRHKLLRFGRSRIHAVGLYAMEPINVNDMVIEYVGEIIRQHVADTREGMYEKMGIGSSYMFRIDTDEIIDATYKGNVARFINHCCEPNCTAKVITVDNEPRIAIYAKRNIDVGEEITYDYKFPIEGTHKEIGAR